MEYIVNEERKNCDTDRASCSKPNLTLEQENMNLRNALSDLRVDANAHVEKTERLQSQRAALVDVLLDHRNYTKNLEELRQWDAKRMEQYRDTLYDISFKCEPIIEEYERLDPDKPEDKAARVMRTDVYELAKAVMKIVRRF